MKFIVFVIDTVNSSGTESERRAVDEFNDKLEANGYWVTAAGIAAPENATLIDNRNGARISSSGSLFDSQEHYSGFWIIEAPDLDTAKQLAFDGSKACNRRVELRPYLR